MNLDAANVLLYLQQEKTARQPALIARRLRLPRERVNGALVLLQAIDKVTKDTTGCWRAC